MRRYPRATGVARPLDPESLAVVPTGFRRRIRAVRDRPRARARRSISSYVMTETNVAARGPAWGGSRTRSGRGARPPSPTSSPAPLARCCSTATSPTSRSASTPGAAHPRDSFGGDFQHARAGAIDTKVAVGCGGPGDRSTGGEHLDLSGPLAVVAAASTRGRAVPGGRGRRPGPPIAATPATARRARRHR